MLSVDRKSRPLPRKNRLRQNSRVAALGALTCWFSLCLLPLGSSACTARSEVTAKKRARSPERGDSVVIEPTAATFFQARVLDRDGARLRVQHATTGRVVTAAVEDAYLPLPRQPEPLPRGAFAICRLASERWLPCRVVADGSASTRVDTTEQSGVSIDRAAVIVPGALTELNIKRHFLAAGRQKDFAAAVEQAGNPATPGQWRPAVGDRVVARHQGRWYSATVRHLNGESVSVQWLGDRTDSDVDSTAVAPEPPYALLPERGRVALTRPESPNQPWSPVRVLGVNPPALIVVGADDDKRTLDRDDVVPLR
jgi:hypothetical protein